MADNNYDHTAFWSCASATGSDIDRSGGGWNTNPLQSDPELQINGNAYIGDIGHGTGVVLTGSNASIILNDVNIFGAIENVQAAGLQYLSQDRFAGGTFEFFIQLSSIPTSDTLFWDAFEHATGTWAGNGGFALWIQATTGKLLYQMAGSATKVDSGLTFSTGAMRHFFIQVHDPKNSGWSLGYDGTCKPVTGTTLSLPHVNVHIGHCGIGASVGHTSGHGVNGTVQNIRYTHNTTLYPTTDTTYTVPTPPYDGVAPTALTLTESGSSYQGPIVTVLPDNAQPTAVTRTFSITNVSGGTGPYTYAWYCRYRGLLNTDTETATGTSITLDLTDLRWFPNHRVYCAVTDTATGVVTTSTEWLVDMRQFNPVTTPNGYIWVENVSSSAGETPTLSMNIYGVGGAYDTIPPDTEPNVSWTWSVFSGSVTGVDQGGAYPDFKLDPLDVADDGSVITVSGSIGYGGDLPYSIASGSTIITVGGITWDTTDGGFWRDHVNSQEAAEGCESVVYNFVAADSYDLGWSDAEAWLVGKTLTDKQNELAALEPDVYSPANRTPYILARYAVIAIDTGDAIPEWTSAMRSPIEGARWWGEDIGIAESDPGSGYTQGTPTFFPEVDEFTTWYNISYKGSFEGGKTAVFDDAQANPKYASLSYDVFAYPNTPGTPEKNFYILAYNYAYDTVWDNL